MSPLGYMPNEKKLLVTAIKIPKRDFFSKPECWAILLLKEKGNRCFIKGGNQTCTFFQSNKLVLKGYMPNCKKQILLTQLNIKTGYLFNARMLGIFAWERKGE